MVKPFVFAPGASGGIRTLDHRIMSQEFDHCAATPSLYALDIYGPTNLDIYGSTNLDILVQQN
jgi:hypothetical protein